MPSLEHQLPEDIRPYTESPDRDAHLTPAPSLDWTRAHVPMTYSQLRAISEAAVAKLYEPTCGADVDTASLPIINFSRRQAGAK